MKIMLDLWEKVFYDWENGIWQPIGNK